MFHDADASAGMAKKITENARAAVTMMLVSARLGKCLNMPR